VQATGCCQRAGTGLELGPVPSALCAVRECRYTRAVAFRNDLDAAHARADALDRKVAALEAENAALRTGEPAKPAKPASRNEARAGLFVVIAVAVLVAGAGIAIALQLEEPVVGVIAGVLGVSVVVSAVLLRSMIHVVPPGTALVVYGRPRRLPDGRTVGYRVVTGGRVVCMPIVERVDRLDLSVQPIRREVRNTFCKGGKLVAVDYAAAICFDPSEPGISNAIERFVGTPMQHVQQVASETLEGAVRGAVATLTLEELQSDRLRVDQYLLANAEPDFAKLGLRLETFAIQEVRES
jgi:hypothetical protein